MKNNILIRNLQTKVKKIGYMHFNYELLNSDIFINELINNLKLNTIYSIHVKVSSNYIFKMCGSQIGVVVKESHNLPYYNKLYDIIQFRIESILESYDYMDKIDIIELEYFDINPPKELLLKDIKELDLPSNIINIKEVKQKFNSKLLPLTTNDKYFGDLIDINSKDYSKYKELLINSEVLNSKFKIHSEDKIFLYKPSKPHKLGNLIILSQQLSKTSLLRHVYSEDNGIKVLSVIDSLEGVLPTVKRLNNTSTSLIKPHSDTDNLTSSNSISFKRQIGKTTLLIKDQEIKEITIDISLKNLTDHKQKIKESFNRDIRFGTFDLETFIDEDGLAKVYTLGFVTYEDSDPTLFYLSDHLNEIKEYKLNNNQCHTTLNYSDIIILNCINKMLKTKYHNFKFYSHNLGKYDVIFVYNTLLKFNKIKGYDYYILNTLLRDNVIIKLEIKIDTNKEFKINSQSKENLNEFKEEVDFKKSKKAIKINTESSKEVIKRSENEPELEPEPGLRESVNVTIPDPKLNKFKHNYIKITFIDSLNLLNNSLDKLGKDFNVPIKKGIFPYRFVTFNNLNYIGNTPTRDYYEEITTEDYNKLIKPDWDLKKEALTYLNHDLKCSLSIMNEFSKILNIHYNIELTQAMTITRLSLNIFFLNYYQKANQAVEAIPVINQLYLFSFIKEAYFGGITEVYRPYGENLAYVDVNSLYPYAALNHLPGTNCKYMESFNKEGLNLINLFGFFYAKIKTNNQYLGLLPVHDEAGNVIYPNGEFEGIWSTPELQFAQEKGYEIKVIKGYNFNKLGINPFKKFITDLYEKKRTSTGSLKIVTKSLLNNLLGRFGLSIIKPMSKIVNIKEKEYIQATRQILSSKTLNDQNYLISYTPYISKEICTQHGLDYIKVLTKEKKLNIETNLDLFKDVSIATVAMLTAHARVFINKIKFMILKNGGRIYYSDTDSLVIDKDFIKLIPTGDELGKFKIEYEDIIRAYFITNKTYCLILKNGQTIIKCKGIISKSLTEKDFINMYELEQNINTMKTNTKTNYQEGSVVIEKKQIVIRYNSYTKRDKIYENGRWIDTKPLNLNNNNK